MMSTMVIIISGHVLTFHAIGNNNRKIVDATHNSQQAILFKREKKAFKDMTFYTVATLLSLLPLLVLLNHVENSIVSGHILFPWAQYLLPANIQSKPSNSDSKKCRFEAGTKDDPVNGFSFIRTTRTQIVIRGPIDS